MHLTPSDRDKLLLSVAGMVARDRRERGVKLNHPEAVALLSTWVIERAREGASVPDLMREGREVLGADEVMDGVAELIPDLQMEATFPDGRKLVTITQPIQAEPGERLRFGEGEVELYAGLPVTTLVVENTGDRPVQVGSHFHFADVNPALSFERDRARGQHLAVAPGTAVRFEPGASLSVDLVPFGGSGRVPGLQLHDAPGAPGVGLPKEY